ncbi:MAG: D-aminoacylase [Lachnospiraceae bacterium]|nr:D-aminoacylase [Lachnospiraceae bacterium]
MYDTVIKNVRILDGTAAPWFRGWIGIRGGRIMKVGTGTPEAAADVVDGEDRHLAPGFIDIHSHSDTSLPVFPLAESRILQGITTEIGGNCGLSVAPVSPDPEKKKLLAAYVGEMDYSWNSMGGYLDYLEEKKLSVNFGTAVGHGTIRLAAMGFEARKATGTEMDFMKRLLCQSLAQGAFSMSSGLIYPPGCYADTDELAELCRELVPYGAFYETHMRDEGEQVVEAVKEALAICKRSGAPLQIAHHKVARKSGWQVHCKTTIAMADQARRQGLDVTMDQYPYRASATSLDSNAPLWAFEGGVEALLSRLRDPGTREQINAETNASHAGRWGDIRISYVATQKNKWTVGKSILEIAKIRKADPADACFDLILDERCHVGEVNYGMCEEDIEYIMKQPYTMIGSDGNAASMAYDGLPHPRWYGTFPRVIAKYCREQKLFSLETAVFKMTGLPACRLGLSDRGLIKEGMWADLVLFDFKTIQDTPTFADPKQPCAGISRVYVNGVLTAENGVHTGASAGKILRRGADGR